MFRPHREWAWLPSRRPTSAVPAAEYFTTTEQDTMRSETQTIVDDIKQGVGLLRRHL